MLTKSQLVDGIRAAGLSGQGVCIHASLRSFGGMSEPPRMIVQTFLDEGCSILVPTFSANSVPPPDGRRLAQNGIDYGKLEGLSRVGGGYSADTNEIEIDEMGRLPQAVLETEGRIRGDHPLNSFASVGPLGSKLIAGQRALDVYAPLRELINEGGSILLIGVDVTKMTLLHLAEQRAGRNLFRRWATYADGRTVEVEVGSCSNGFKTFEPVLASVTKRCSVGSSEWKVVSASAALKLAADAIKVDPSMTHCGNPRCERCNDAVLGGPIL